MLSTCHLQLLSPALTWPRSVCGTHHWAQPPIQTHGTNGKATRTRIKSARCADECRICTRHSALHGCTLRALRCKVACPPVCARVCVSVCVCVCVRMRAGCAWLCVPMRMRVCVPMRTRVCAHACVRMRVCVRLCVHARAHVNLCEGARAKGHEAVLMLPWYGTARHAPGAAVPHRSTSGKSLAPPRPRHSQACPLAGAHGLAPRR